MEGLAGPWVMDKGLSSGVDAILKIQGISWPLRKAVGLASIRLNISIYPDDKETSSGATVIDVLQTATGGLAGTRERRIMDWTAQDHTDYIFGPCKHCSCFVHGSASVENDGGVYPEFEVQTQSVDEKARRFLRGEIFEDGSSSVWVVSQSGRSDDKDVWVHTFVQNVDSEWTAEQVWGFEDIHGKKYHTRRLLVSNAKGHVMGRLVYRYEGTGST
ncbi:hypothetical protein BDW59DRAFT_179196 [Aspergillus cavernicola]|uniref:Uncharacterized protein n=1 Tax=Aspergillus cavernicola TaxID=176166 RepID=A0ABR4IHH5_9EURO